MATTITTPTGTTTTTSRTPRSNSANIMYALIGLAIVLAIALFFVMRRNSVVEPAAVPPTTVEQRSDSTSNPAAPTPGVAPNTGNPAENRY